MVRKLWCHDIAYKWFQDKKIPHARVFSEPKCQEHANTWYMFYRWLIFMAWVAIIICSLFEIGSYKPLGKSYMWPIYLTNWDLTLGMTQAFLGACIVTNRWKSQRTSLFDPLRMQTNIIIKVYWFLYIVTSSIAIGVTVSYWAAVYSPKIHQIDPLNIMLHICNSLLMILDLCITRIPFKSQHFWWCMPIISLYVIFSIIYYFAGGLDKFGNHYIYKILDWAKPGRTILVCCGGLVFVIIVHFLLCLLEKLKHGFYKKLMTEKPSEMV